MKYLLHCLLFPVSRLGLVTVVIDTGIIEMIKVCLKSVSHGVAEQSDVVYLCRCKSCSLYTPWHEKRVTVLLSISLPIIDRFSKFFHSHTLQTICNNVIIIYPITP